MMEILLQRKQYLRGDCELEVEVGSHQMAGIKEDQAVVVITHDS